MRWIVVSKSASRRSSVALRWRSRSFSRAQLPEKRIVFDCRRDNAYCRGGVA
jgi:hypothetical protein